MSPPSLGDSPLETSGRARSALIIAGLVILFLCLAPLWQGINLFDDTYYFIGGIYVRPANFVRAYADSPLYCTWLWVLTQFLHDGLWRYMISWCIFVVLLAAIPFWFRVAYAWLYAFLVICLPIFCIIPMISFFAATFVVAASSWITSRKPSLATSALLAVVVSFAITYARPEFAYGTVIASIAAAIALFFSPE